MDYMPKLLDFYEDGAERVGFILQSGEIVECENKCDQPEEGFEVSAEDLIRYCDDAVATWHTHPGANSNLSVGDYESFMSWPKLLHHIIGQDGLSTFMVHDGAVICVGGSTSMAR